MEDVVVGRNLGGRILSIGGYKSEGCSKEKKEDFLLSAGEKLWPITADIMWH